MKKGFTLIELLAVIVILAVIALIAVPRIMDAIDDARRGSYTQNEYAFIKAAENYLASNANNYTFEPDTTIKVHIESLMCEYIKSLNDCEGYVLATNTNNSFFYTPYLKCDDFESDGVIKDNLVLDLPLGDQIENNQFISHSPTVIAENFGLTPALNRFNIDNKASFLDGDSYIRTNVDLKGEDNFTYSLWFIWEDGTGLRTFFGQNSNSLRTLRISTTGTTTARFSTYWDTTSGTSYGLGSPIQRDIWYKVTIVKTPGLLSFYLNDELDWELPVLDEDVNSILIGRQQGQSRNFIGTFSDVRIYNRALTQTEIKHNYEMDLRQN